MKDIECQLHTRFTDGRTAHGTHAFSRHDHGCRVRLDEFRQGCLCHRKPKNLSENESRYKRATRQCLQAMQLSMQTHKGLLELSQVVFGQIRLGRFANCPGHTVRKIQGSKTLRPRNNGSQDLLLDMRGHCYRRTFLRTRQFFDKFEGLANQFRAIHIVAAVDALNDILIADTNGAVLHDTLRFLSLDHPSLGLTGIRRGHCSRNNAFPAGHLMLEEFRGSQSFQIAIGHKATTCRPQIVGSKCRKSSSSQGTLSKWHTAALDCLLTDTTGNLCNVHEVAFRARSYND